MRVAGEPCSLKLCLPEAAAFLGRLFTCARPGRSLGRKASVPDEIVEEWVDGLPAADTVHLVSLLGTKEDKDETPEYAFYSFRGVGEPADGRPTFQEWLDDKYGRDRFVVHDYPTVDAGDWSISQEGIDSLIDLILPLLSRGETVVLFDSGGSQRTGQFCRAAGFRRRPWSRVSS